MFPLPVADCVLFSMSIYLIAVTHYLSIAITICCKSVIFITIAYFLISFLFLIEVAVAKIESMEEMMPSTVAIVSICFALSCCWMTILLFNICWCIYVSCWTRQCFAFSGVCADVKLSKGSFANHTGSGAVWYLVHARIDWASLGYFWFEVNTILTTATM